MGSTLHLLDCATSLALDGFDTYLVEAFHKEIAVFGIDDGLYGSSQDFNTIFLEYATLIEFHTTVKGGLTTKREQNTIRALLFNDTLHEVGLYGLEIDGISHTL